MKAIIDAVKRQAINDASFKEFKEFVSDKLIETVPLIHDALDEAYKKGYNDAKKEFNRVFTSEIDNIRIR